MKKITKTILVTGLMAALAGGSIFAKTTVSIKSTFLEDLAEALTDSVKVSLTLENDDEDELKKKKAKKPLDAGTKKPCPEAEENQKKTAKKPSASKQPAKKEAKPAEKKDPKEFEWDWEKDDPYKDWPENFKDEDLKKKPSEPKKAKNDTKKDSGKKTSTTTTTVTTKTTTTTTTTTSSKK